MISIDTVEINNFRSIIKLEKGFNPKDLNIIVGQNDIGKSNFLKALNLFFNGETEIGNPFRFNDDFSKYAKVPNKKAGEVIIKIVFKIPQRFKDTETLIWTKIWRKEGLHSDVINTQKGDIPSGRSGALQWVKKLKYKYVPAVRGSEYFNYLMGDLHDALSEINPKAFNEASSSFIDGLKSQVQLLIQNISTELGYSSQIDIPSNFKLLFSTLDFALNKNGTMISLNKRGDGIKAQHIPIILKFIANHYKSISGKAIIPPDTIWGFEEPENNLEMGNAFKLAKIFASFSDDIQIFINTHSPAFYSLAKDYTDKTSLYLVKSNNEITGTKLINISIKEIELFDKEVGILPIISDYIKKEVELRIIAEKKNEELAQLKSNTQCLVLTEDMDVNPCKVLFESQGFNISTTEFISYESRSNLLAAMQSCKIKLTDKPDLTHIIFHRDRDMYDDDELDKERVEGRLDNLNSEKRIKYYLFKTTGYDIESHFINADHVKKLCPSLSIEKINQLIKDATLEAKEKSLDKLYHKIEHYRKTYEMSNQLYKFSPAKYINLIKDLYESNPTRYRYGKKVLGYLTAKIQKEVGNIDLIQKSEFLLIPELQAICNEINKK